MKGISGIYKDMDKPLLFSTIGLFIFGLFNIVTASSSEAVERYGVSIFYYFSKQLIILGAGFIACLFILRTNTKNINKFLLFVFLE